MMSLNRRAASRAMLAGLVALAVSGCGDEAITGAAIVGGPADGTITYEAGPVGTSMSVSPLEFQVVGADGVTPIDRAPIRFFGGFQTAALTDRSGNVLNPATPLFFETVTDKRGLPSVEVFAQWVVPGCKANLEDPGIGTGTDTTPGPDTTVTATVEASIGVAQRVWTLTIVRKGGITRQGCIGSP